MTQQWCHVTRRFESVRAAVSRCAVVGFFAIDTRINDATVYGVRTNRHLHAD
jgi:hypothetical protein